MFLTKQGTFGRLNPRRNSIQSERKPPLTVGSSQGRLCVVIRPLRPSQARERESRPLSHASAGCASVYASASSRNMRLISSLDNLAIKHPPFRLNSVSPKYPPKTFRVFSPFLDTILRFTLKVNPIRMEALLQIYAQCTPYFIFSISCFSHSNSR